jgi:hypothetical protein
LQSLISDAPRREVRSESREQRCESREQRCESREQRGENTEERAERRGSKVCMCVPKTACCPSAAASRTRVGNRIHSLCVSLYTRPGAAGVGKLTKARHEGAGGGSKGPSKLVRGIRSDQKKQKKRWSVTLPLHPLPLHPPLHPPTLK